MSLSNVNVQGNSDTETGNVISLEHHRQSPAHASADSHGPVLPCTSLPAATFQSTVFLDQMKVSASIEIDDLVWIRGHFSSRVRDQIVASIRKLLCQEFGRNMIQRNELIFVVRHRRVETLVAGLLRVQFYANQVLLPEFNIIGERVDQNGVSVTWGVGQSPEEASLERVKKRKRRMLRRR